MKKRKLLAGAVVAAIGGLAMTSIANATATVTPLEGEVIEYVLNSGFDTASVFTAGVLQIHDGETKIFILDRNLGATAAGTGCEVQNWQSAACYGDGNEFDVYGYHFQRGNNYGFKPCTGSLGCRDFPNRERASIGRVSTIGYGPGNYYYGNVFLYEFEGSNGMDWSEPHNDNLRGGSEGDYISSLSGDNWKVDNPKDRQGPCPENFHVPSYGEFLKIKSMMGNNVNEIHNKLLVPFAGYRTHYGDVFYLGYYANLWSSSPCHNCLYAPSLNFNFNEIVTYYYNYDYGYDIDLNPRAAALSLRCVYDSYQIYTKASDLLVSFWTGEDITVESSCSGQVASGEVISGDLLTCVEGLSGSKQRYSLSGRRDVEANTVWTLDTPVTTGLTLQAVWTPDTDANNNGKADQEESFTITREDRDGNFVWSGEFEYGTGPVFGGTYPEKTGHTFTGWSPSVENVTGDFTYIATWAVNQYTITFNTDGGSTISPITGDFGSAITVPTNPTKNGYDFAGWDSAIPSTMPAENTVITALWTAKPAPRPSSGGGGGTTLRKDRCPGGDYSDSYYDGICGIPENDTENGGEGSGDDNNKDSSATPQNDSKASTGATNKSPGTEGEGSKKDSSSQAPQNYKTGHNSADDFQYDTLKFNQKYSNEMNQAYQYAYHYGITTKDTIRNADVNGKLTRIAMAKMISQYAINVLGMKPDKTRIKKFDDVSKKLDSDYDNGVTLAYQLGIMGINMPNNRFRPFDYVPRSEFVTALSRMKYGTPDGKDVYYSTHMELLKRLGIITNTNPNMLELRGFVMIMLMKAK